MGAYAGAARRRVYFATVLLRPPSGHRPDRCLARHARTLPDATTKRVDTPSGVPPAQGFSKTRPSVPEIVDGVLEQEGA